MSSDGNTGGNTANSGGSAANTGNTASTPNTGRPQYGEFATPAEQAKARGIEAAEAAEPGPTGMVPLAQAHPRPPYGAAVPASAAASRPEPYASTARPERKHPVDRWVTIGLLIIGLITVVTSAPNYLNLAATVQLAYDQLGGGTYQAPEQARVLGIVAVVGMVLIWLGTLAGSLALMRKNRIAWWVPVVGGAVSFIMLVVILTIALMSDPALVENLGGTAP